MSTTREESIYRVLAMPPNKSLQRTRENASCSARGPQLAR
jgi:hypothetical protein